MRRCLSLDLRQTFPIGINGWKGVTHTTQSATRSLCNGTNDETETTNLQTRAALSNGGEPRAIAKPPNRAWLAILLPCRVLVVTGRAWLANIDSTDSSVSSSRTRLASSIDGDFTSRAGHSARPVAESGFIILERKLIGPFCPLGPRLRSTHESPIAEGAPEELKPRGQVLICGSAELASRYAPAGQSTLTSAAYASQVAAMESTVMFPPILEFNFFSFRQDSIFSISAFEGLTERQQGAVKVTNNNEAGEFLHRT